MEMTSQSEICWGPKQELKMKAVTIYLLSAVVCLSNAQSSFRRTVVAIERPTSFTEYIFLRGGAADGRSIPIEHNIVPKDSSSFYSQTSKGDTKLEWGSFQSGQGVYRNGHLTKMAEGTPMVWTTDNNNYGQTVDENGVGYWKLNTGGSNFWVVDMNMDCSAVPGGWFAFKGYVIDLYGSYPGWESSNINQYSCDMNGTNVNIPRAQSWNHYGVCGHFNIVRWNNGFCMSRPVSEVEDIVKLLEI